MSSGPNEERDPIADTAQFQRFVDDAVPARDPGVPQGRGTVFGSGLSAVAVVLVLAIPVLLLVAGKAAGGADANRVLAIAAYSLAGLAVVLCAIGYFRDRRRLDPIDVLGPIVVIAAVLAAVVLAIAL